MATETKRTPGVSRQSLVALMNELIQKGPGSSDVVQVSLVYGLLGGLLLTLGALVFLFVPDKYELVAFAIIVAFVAFGLLAAAMLNKKQKRFFITEAERRGISRAEAEGFWKTYDWDRTPDEQL